MFDDILSHIPETEEDVVRAAINRFLKYYRYEPPDQDVINDIKDGIERIMEAEIGKDWRKKYYIQIDHNPDHGYGVTIR